MQHVIHNVSRIKYMFIAHVGCVGLGLNIAMYSPLWYTTDTNWDLCPSSYYPWIMYAPYNFAEQNMNKCAGSSHLTIDSFPLFLYVAYCSNISKITAITFAVYNL